MTPSPSWPELPPELLSLISTKLLTLSGLLRFRGVCRSWRSAASNPTAKLPPRQLPLLALPTDPASAFRSFFNPRTGTAHSVHLPEALGFAVFGSSSGWLFLVNKFLDSFLLNPLTLSKIRLPPLPSSFLPVVWLDRRERTCTDLYRLIYNLECYAFMEPRRSPHRPPQGIVAFVYRSAHHFIFCRSGDEEWTRFLGISKEARSIASLAFHKGNFYFADVDGVVSVWDASGRGGQPERIPHTLPPLEAPGFRRMVVLDDDELTLIVCRDLRTWRLQVFRLDLKREDPRWEMVKGIRGHTVFMSTWWPRCLLLTDAVGYGGNNIYCPRWMNSGPGRAEIEVYDVGDERIRTLPCNSVIGEGGLKVMASTWFAASLS